MINILNIIYTVYIQYNRTKIKTLQIWCYDNALMLSFHLKPLSHGFL